MEVNMGKTVDIIGKTFNRWTVIKDSESKGNRGQSLVWCKCECGTVREVVKGNLKNGASKSCGCLNIERIKKRTTKHSKSNSKLYYIYNRMIYACTKPQNFDYKYYGGRGIEVCEEWLNSFQAFHDWALANGYDENAPYGKCTIDRIDNNGNYEPSNCRWVDMKQQSQNKRTNNKINGKCIGNIANEVGLSSSALAYRKKQGKSVAEILNPMPYGNQRKVRKNVKGYYYSAKDKSFVAELVTNGKRHTKNCKTKEEAIAYRKKLEELQDKNLLNTGRVFDE
jgi:hypothetical protein